MPNLPLCLWSSQLFDLRAPWSTDVPVLLLNQPKLLYQGMRELMKRRMRKLKKYQELKREIAKTVDMELMRTVQVIAGCRVIGK